MDAELHRQLLCQLAIRNFDIGAAVGLQYRILRKDKHIVFVIGLDLKVGGQPALQTRVRLVEGYLDLIADGAACIRLSWIDIEY